MLAGEDEGGAPRLIGAMDNYNRVQCQDCAHYGLSIKVPHKRRIIDGRFDNEVEYRDAVTCRLRLGHVPDKWRRCDEFRANEDGSGAQSRA